MQARAPKEPNSKNRLVDITFQQNNIIDSDFFKQSQNFLTYM